MKVYIDNHLVTIADGARVKDAVLAFSKDSYRSLLAGRISVVDSFGNLTGPDGPASENQHFTLAETPLPGNG